MHCFLLRECFWLSVDKTILTNNLHWIKRWCSRLTLENSWFYLNSIWTHTGMGCWVRLLKSLPTLGKPPAMGSDPCDLWMTHPSFASWSLWGLNSPPFSKECDLWWLTMESTHFYGFLTQLCFAGETGRSVSRDGPGVGAYLVRLERAACTIRVYILWHHSRGRDGESPTVLQIEFQKLKCLFVALSSWLMALFCVVW